MSLHRKLALAISGALVALSMGCENGNFGSIAVSGLEGDPAARIDFDTEISIPEGSAASAQIDVIAVDGDSMTGQFESGDLGILQILADPLKPNTYVFLGVSAGKTSIVVLANGRSVRQVHAVVTPPPSASVALTLLDAGETTVPPVDAGKVNALDGAQDATGE